MLLREILQLGLGENVDGAAESEDPRRHVDAGQGGLAIGVGADRGDLPDPVVGEGRDQIQEVGFRAAFAGCSEEMEDAHAGQNLAGLCAAPKPLEDQKKPPYKPRLAERSGGWIAQMVRAVDS